MGDDAEMQLSPRYGTDPILVVETDPVAVLEPLVRQRRRFADALAGFSAEQWANPSRCDGWSSQDVALHLESTNSFWTFSTDAGRKGTPTEFLATFDPVASPAALVDAAGDLSHEQTLERFVAASDAFTTLLTSLDDAEWANLAEAPPGHVSITALAHHALWDSWVHERDVLLPLGIDPVVEADEVAACLRYAAVLGSGFALTNGSDQTGTLAIDASDPAVALTVAIDGRATVRDGIDTDADLVLTGSAVDLVEALSIRGPLPCEVPEESAWMVAGLAEVFEA